MIQMPFRQYLNLINLAYIILYEIYIKEEYTQKETNRRKQIEGDKWGKTQKGNYIQEIYI